MGQRFHNWIFAFILFVVIVVTAWSILVREPTLMGPTSIPDADIGQATPPAGDAVKTEKKAKKGITEELIESGKLSRHPAEYYKKIE